ncbi:MAG: alpha/beta fold hydrolase [Candidatus Limnocylindrales bacterium]
MEDGRSSELHVTSWGGGEPVVFVHGSFVRGGSSWAAQRPLADRYRLLFVDRRGYGASPSSDGEDFARDADDLVELLGGGAHLVGHSYGGVASLIAAARRPSAVRSLTVIEPPAFQLAPASPTAQAMQERIRIVFGRAADMAPAAFYPAFLEAMGYDLETLGLRSWSDLGARLRPESLAAMVQSMRQRMPWEAEIPLDRLAAAAFPKLVISGGWDTASAATRASAGAGLRDVCEVLAARIGARRAVIPGAFHAPHSAQPALFNACLRGFLDSAPGS